MCGRYTLYHTLGEIEELFQVNMPGLYAPRYNIAPTQPVLIIRENPHVSEGREAVHVVWGLIPPWADDPRIGSKMINARCETAAEKPSYKYPLRRRRCIVPVSGFYEWSKLAATPHTPAAKQPYLIKNSDNTPLALAGIWEVWHGPNGELIESCSILTTAANAMMAPLHDRMPVIILPDRAAEWLDTRNDDSRSLGHFFNMHTLDSLVMHPVSPLVNSVRNDSADLVAPAGLL